MKRVLILLIVLTAVSSITNAQSEQTTYEFQSVEKFLDVTQIDANEEFEHVLGEQIAKKIYLLEQAYTWRDAPTDIKPTATIVVEKPGIYNSVRKIERFYKKSVRKGWAKPENLAVEFESILDVVLQVRYQNTVALESHLYSLKNPEDLVALLIKEVEIRY